MKTGLDQTWEAQFLDSLLGMVHVPYGDFVAVSNLSRASIYSAFVGINLGNNR